jgi:HYR domain
MTHLTNPITGHIPARAPRAGKSPVAGALKALLAVVALAAGSAHAVVYDFLPVTITSFNSGYFTSSNGNGIITVTNTGGPFESLNSTVYVSAFTNLFPANVPVQGWLSQVANLAVYTNTFYLDNYTLTSNTVFGMWNITEETNTYHLQLFDKNNTLLSPPFNWNFIGYDDNIWPPDVNIAWYHMNLNNGDGYFYPFKYKTNGIDCDGAFWNKIPTNTARIVFTGVMNTTNHDGVAFYFAEQRLPCAIRCPPDITVVLCGPSGTNVNYPLPTVFGDCGTNTAVFCDPASGSLFSLGTNVVHCSVPGQSNLFCSFTVTVLKSDPIPPVINCPSNILVFTCSTSAVVTYTVTASDNSGTVYTNISIPSGSTFPLGTNTVYFTATDDCSNLASCQFDVTVKPYPPVWGVICPNETFTTNVTGCPPVMPSLTNLVIITNQCTIPGGLSITQAPPAGTVLSAGNYQVTITVCATNGSCQNCYLSVNATLGSGCCTIACPTNPLTVTTCGSNAVVTFATPAISGPCVSNSTVFCAPPSGSTFPLGTNTVVCLATNGAGATLATCSFSVIVVASAFTNAYDFLPVTITGPGAKFTSLHGYGVITVTNTGGPFLGFNNIAWASQFTNLFLASGTVTGWLAQADNFARYTNTFYLAGYILKTNTVFGMWNITEETNTYSIRLLDASGSQIAPVFNWNFLGYDDDALAGNISWYHMNLNPNTGIFSPVPYKLSGIDCDGAFWDNIPLNTRKIVVTGTLGALNADGVVFYFAERRPCPAIPCPFCPVDLGVTLAGSAIILSWPQSATNYVLEGTSDLVGPLAGWSAVTNSPTATNGEYQVALPAQHPRMFYRLKQMPSP